MSASWGRQEEPDLAAEKILDAAGKAFSELGLSAAGMTEIADAAGCSRGTLYRYFKNRHELHLAYVERAATQIAARVQAKVAGSGDPGERLSRAILAAVREVRRDPGTAAWFEPGASGMAARMSRSSEVVEAVAGRFVAELPVPARSRRDKRLLARWLVRVIVSLLAMPGESAAEERALVERFVAPLVSPRPGGSA